MKNKLSDLNNHLFAQIERLGDESISGDKLKEEIQRSQAVNNVAKMIVSNARLALDAQIAIQDMRPNSQLPEMLEAK